MVKIISTVSFLIVILFVNPALFADGKDKSDNSFEIETLMQEDFQIIDNKSGNSIFFLESIDDMIIDFGDPAEVVVGPNSTDSNWDRIVHKYPGFWVTAYRKWMNIIYMWIQSDQFFTPRGISIGDSVESVLENYGQPDYTRSGRYIYQYKLEGTGGYWVIRFKINDGKVVDILMDISD